MGGAKRQLEKDEAEGPLLDFAELLIERGMIEGAALGVAKQALDKGLDSLSDRQREVFNDHVIGDNRVEECDRCGNGIEDSELCEALDSGLCNYCEVQVAKIAEE